jgi:hypothetical protein
MPKPRFSGFVPPIPPTIDGSHGIGKSLLVISTCMQLLHSPTPICRYAMENGFYLHLEVKSLATSPISNGLRNFMILHDDFKSSILFLLKSPSVPELRLIQSFSWVCSHTVYLELSLLSLTSPTPSTESWRTPCTRRPITLQVLGLLNSMHSRNSNPCLPPLRLTSETSNPTCASPAWFK